MIREEVNLRKHFVEVEDSYFVHESIFHFGEIESLLQRKANKPYYIPKKELLLCYKDDEFYEENKQTKKLYRLLEKYVQPDNVNSVGKNIRSVVCEWIIKADIRGKHFLSWYFLLGLAKQVKPIDPVWQIMRKGEVRPNLVLREK